MKRILDIFKIHREERIATLVAFTYFTLLNIINICNYWDKFSVISDHYHKLFVSTYHVSGFDPLTYVVLSNWWPSYNVYRHPLLAFFMFPFNQINQGLMQLTGLNFAMIVAALVLVGCATYSFVFLLRILHNVIGISHRQALILCAMYFSFGFIMLSSMVPDHFVMSQCCLLLTLWLSGEKLKKGSALNLWQTIALFVVTAGVSLNNGLKVFLAALITRRLRFFNWRYLLLAVALPSALMWGTARWEYRQWVWPMEQKRYAMKKEQQKAEAEKLRNEVRDSILRVTSAKSKAAPDSAAIAKEIKRVKKNRDHAKYVRDHKQMWNVNAGKPIAKGEFMNWTDKSTPRWDTAVENLFGEAIQLHHDYPLCDVLRDRPLIVRYAKPWSWINYTVELLLILLFLAGIWCGRRSLLMWTAMSFFIMDMALHMGLGFGINEIYIMSAHYLFVMPIAMAFFYKKGGRISTAIEVLTAVTALWLIVWNIIVII